MYTFYDPTVYICTYMYRERLRIMETLVGTCVRYIALAELPTLG